MIGFLGLQLLKNDWLETSFLALLPTNEQQPEIESAIKQHNQLSNRKVIWLVGGVSADLAIANAKTLKQQLEDSLLFNTVTLEQSQQPYAKQYQALFPYRFQLLDASVRELLTKNPDDLLQQNLELLNSPLAQLQTAGFEQDPLLLFNRYFSGLQPIKLNLQQGMVLLADQQQQWLLLLTELKDERLQLDKLEALLTLEQTARSHLKQRAVSCW